MGDEANIFDMDEVLDMVYMVGNGHPLILVLLGRVIYQDGMVEKIENLKKFPPRPPFYAS